MMNAHVFAYVHSNTMEYMVSLRAKQISFQTQQYGKQIFYTSAFHQISLVL